MAEQTLTGWLKTAYPHVKEASGLPPWLLPEKSLFRTADEIGDRGLLTMGQPLGLTDGVEYALRSAGDPSLVSADDWQERIRRWPYLSQVTPVVVAFVETADMIMARLPLIARDIAPDIISRSLAVLLFAPFIDRGRTLLEDVAAVLGGDAGQPAQLIRRYGECVTNRDSATLERVNGCIVQYRYWQAWAQALQQTALTCRHMPRLIAITPPPSAEMTAVLVAMMMEENDES